MESTNQKLLALTASMPCKQINLPVYTEKECAFTGTKELVQTGEKPYLQRYYAGTFRDNKDLWIHRFLSGDSERHLHCHPFNFKTIVINGGYYEQRINRATKERESIFHGCINVDIVKIERMVKMLGHGIEQARPWSDEFPGGARSIDVFDWHRIESASSETWTMLLVDPDRLPAWFFIDDNGAIEHRTASPRDWWKSFGKRGDNLGDVA